MIAEVDRLVAVPDRGAALEQLVQIRAGTDAIWARLAALHLAGGKLALIPQWVALANDDMRNLQVAVTVHLEPGWDARFRWPATGAV
ncbi:MAG TPA: hypothetical protein VK986_15010 [Tepidisphaeraceae bacterium]|nr:hypothetical protein [Tepidisphaeraceae bacterium]